jgi:hypothetical protein
MAHTWIQHCLHGFEDCEPKIKHKGKIYAVEMGEGFLAIYGELEELINFFTSGLEQLQKFKEEDYEQERRRAEEK